MVDPSKAARVHQLLTDSSDYAERAYRVVIDAVEGEEIEAEPATELIRTLGLLRRQLTAALAAVGAVER